MKRSMTVCAVAAALFLVSMSGLGGSDDAVPTPDRNFAATITDKTNVVTRAQYLACEKIRSAEFRNAEKDVQQVTLVLNDGTTHQVQVPNGEKCTGTTDLGAMSIRAKDLLRVEIEPAPKPAAPKEPSR